MKTQQLLEETLVSQCYSLFSCIMTSKQHDFTFMFHSLRIGEIFTINNIFWHLTHNFLHLPCRENLLQDEPLLVPRKSPFLRLWYTMILFIITWCCFDVMISSCCYVLLFKRNLTHCLLGNFACFFPVCWFFKIDGFKKFLTRIPSLC